MGLMLAVAGTQYLKIPQSQAPHRWPDCPSFAQRSSYWIVPPDPAILEPTNSWNVFRPEVSNPAHQSPHDIQLDAGRSPWRCAEPTSQ